MSEYIAKQGTTALGIIGTALGGLAVVGNGMGLLNNGGGCYQNSNATMHDIEDTQKLAEKDAEIARLNSERYSDAALASAKEFTTQATIDIYKELKADINTMKEQAAGKWSDQAVINANITNGMTAINGQVQSTAALVAQITKTAVPTSAICNFGCGCQTGCGNNV